MPTPPPLEILQVAGSHGDCGRQVGRHWADHLQRAVDFASELPKGRGMDEHLALADRYREATDAFPWVVEEIDGMAIGGRVDALTLFAVTVEEIWAEDEAESGPIGEGRCSDLIAGPGATSVGRLLVAHNNDLSAAAEEELLAIEWAVPGEPTTLTIGGPPWLSVGFNDAGLAFTGNQLYPNDERVGIPRQLQFRAMLRETSIDQAMVIALDPRRASSYNNIVADATRVANVEGSATDAEVTELEGPAGHLAHTNHYACERMLVREDNPRYAKHSAVRLGRALELLGEAPLGSLTTDTLRAMLADHQHAPDSLCRHPEAVDDSKTVFWCVADPGMRAVTFGRGNPCDSQAQTYTFPA